MGATFGVVFGGLLTRFAGWQYVFLLNVPVGVVALLLYRSTQHGDIFAEQGDGKEPQKDEAGSLLQSDSRTGLQTAAASSNTGDTTL